MQTIIRKMREEDIQGAANVHKETFVRQRDSEKWITCNYQAYPRIQQFVAIQEDCIIGYIQWVQKSGFREEVVLELEQIGVLPSHQGKGVGRRLIVESLPLVVDELGYRDAVLKHVMVTTRADNYAQRLYWDVLGAEIECTVTALYSADEVIMISRNIDINAIKQKK